MKATEDRLYEVWVVGISVAACSNWELAIQLAKQYALTIAWGPDRGPCMIRYGEVLENEEAMTVLQAMYENLVGYQRQLCLKIAELVRKRRGFKPEHVRLGPASVKKSQPLQVPDLKDRIPANAEAFDREMWSKLYGDGPIKFEDWMWRLVYGEPMTPQKMIETCPFELLGPLGIDPTGPSMD